MVEKTCLATRIRTVKELEITVPNTGVPSNPIFDFRTPAHQRSIETTARIDGTAANRARPKPDPGPSIR